MFRGSVPAAPSACGALCTAGPYGAIALHGNPLFLQEGQRFSGKTRLMTQSPMTPPATTWKENVDANETAMQRALAGIDVAEITRASRSATVDGVAVTEGEFLALVGGSAFATGADIWTVLDALVERFAADGHSFVQVLRGDGAPEAEEITAWYADRAGGLELDVQWGGQPHYPLLLSAE